MISELWTVGGGTNKDSVEIGDRQSGQSGLSSITLIKLVSGVAVAVNHTDLPCYARFTVDVTTRSNHRLRKGR